MYLCFCEEILLKKIFITIRQRGSFFKKAITTFKNFKTTKQKLFSTKMMIHSFENSGEGWGRGGWGANLCKKLSCRSLGVEVSVWGAPRFVQSVASLVLLPHSAKKEKCLALLSVYLFLNKAKMTQTRQIAT